MHKRAAGDGEQSAVEMMLIYTSQLLGLWLGFLMPFILKLRLYPMQLMLPIKWELERLNSNLKFAMYMQLHHNPLLANWSTSVQKIISSAHKMLFLNTSTYELVFFNLKKFTFFWFNLFFMHLCMGRNLHCILCKSNREWLIHDRSRIQNSHFGDVIECQLQPMLEFMNHKPIQRHVTFSSVTT
jgi:hypothetical protein